MTLLRAVIWCAVSTRPQAASDKISLDDQESVARALCEKHNWQITKVLKVPGFSRDYFTLAECAAAMAGEGIDAFVDLQDLLARRSFDALLIYGGDRFARKQSLHSEVVERVIDAGARLFVTRTGQWIDSSNFRMFTAFDGYRSASEIDLLKERNKTGMDARILKGLPAARFPFSHVLARDQAGKAMHVELRPGLERLWTDLASSLLAGHGYPRIVRLLYEQGHRQPDTGKPLRESTLRRLLHSPTTWGHVARRFRGRTGLWAFDEQAPLPPGLLVERHCIPPIYAGALAERIQAELRRRAVVFHGSARPETVHALSGLLVCAGCGRRLRHSTVNANAKGRRAHAYWRCTLLYDSQKDTGGRACANSRHLPDEKARRQITDFLARWIRLARPDIPAPKDPHHDAVLRADSLRAELAGLEAQIDRLLSGQMQAPENLQPFYAERLAGESARLDALRAALRRAESEVEPPAVRAERVVAYDDLISMAQEKLDRLWDDPRRANQLLHRLLGRHRFVVRDGEIVDLA